MMHTTSKRVGEAGTFRLLTIAILGIFVCGPVGLIFYQSLLDGPFFDAMSSMSLDSYRFLLGDSEFYRALFTTFIFAFGMVVIAVPLGAAIAFLVTRTDLKGRKWLETIVLMPMFISAIVLGFGYTVSIGPAGFVSLAFQSVFGFVPWNIYTLTGLIIIAGLSHVPHVYLYVSAAMRTLPADLEEAARTSGAKIWQVALHVTWPLVMPSLVFATALNVLLAFEAFGLPLVLGDPSGVLVLTTYIYKLTSLFGLPAYNLMAAVAVILLALTFPLVFVQRIILKRARKFATVGGKGSRVVRIRLGKSWQFAAWAIIGTWLVASVVLPIAGITVRAFVDTWGMNVNLLEHITLQNFQALFEVDALSRGLINTALLAVLGGALAVLIYLIIGLANHRWHGPASTSLDYMVLLPRALPGLLIGLAMFWVFLFVPPLQPFRTTLVSLLVAYVIIGLSYGLRLIQASLLQVAPELEEGARTVGATIYQTWRSVLIPIIRPGLLGAWTMIMIMFLKEYATGVYLLTAGTEVIGTLIVSQLASGALEIIAALSFISIVLTTAGLAIATRLGATKHD
ncbi:ABC transporter permease [Agrobacterium larrymoorei]|uniref:Iron ABC transporter permease n=1 Tax=Agrobacterium larrymoorei TaxID=160699 RepID=A0AAF0HFX9_9HYPH|nr:iron ABC transporter permease [Agrobacterium larrymoorei]WHA44013.1 iron ABC transporter permease [Agrobacterium larrymoorei]